MIRTKEGEEIRGETRKENNVCEVGRFGLVSSACKLELLAPGPREWVGRSCCKTLWFFLTVR